MTCSTVKRLTKPLDKPEREFRRLRRAALRSHQNDSLAIARRNLFDDEASSSNDSRPKTPTSPKTLHEHSCPTSSSFQNPITFPTEQTKRIDDRVKLDQFTQFCFHSLTEEEAWIRIEEYVQYQDDLWDEPSPSMSIYSISESMQPTLRGRLKRACKANHFPRRSCSRAIDRSKTPEPEAPTLAITTRSGIYMQDPPFLTPPDVTTNNSTERGTKREKPEGTENRTAHEPVPRSPILYQPSNTSNPPFPSRLKKQKKDEEDERLLSIFKQIHINLPFLEAMIHMPKGAKVLKDLLSHKEKLEKAVASVKLSEECSAIIQKTQPQK
ncbi:hypothetical protein Tco_0014264 [Tanacetum coccineum]